MNSSVWRRLTRGDRFLREQPGWREFLGDDWPDRIMGLPVTDRFSAKQGRSTGRLIVEANGRRLGVYLKRHYQLEWWRGVFSTLSPGWSPAFEEWDHLRWARAEGFAVPDAVAAAEFVGPWGRLQSVLAVGELVGMLPLHEAIPLASRRCSPDRFAAWKRALCLEVARLSSGLHRRRWFHKDLYLCHFYVPEADVGRPEACRGGVHLIDLHRLGRHPLTWPVWQVKDLAQLLYSSDTAGVSPRDRVRFWRAYAGPDRHGWFGRWLRRWVELKWRRYRDHNDRRRARVVAERAERELARRDQSTRVA